MHHLEFEESKLTLKDMEKMVSEKKILYDHNLDKKSQNKWFTDQTLKKIDLKILPDIISYEKETYKEWID